MLIYVGPWLNLFENYYLDQPKINLLEAGVTFKISNCFVVRVVAYPFENLCSCVRFISNIFLPCHTNNGYKC